MDELATTAQSCKCCSPCSNNNCEKRLRWFRALLLLIPFIISSEWDAACLFGYKYSMASLTDMVFVEAGVCVVVVVDAPSFRPVVIMDIVVSFR